MHLPGRMFRRNIQCGKVIEIIFNIRAFGNIKSHPGKNFGNFIHYLTDGMNTPCMLRPGRQGNVYLFLLQLRIQRRRVQSGFCLVNGIPHRDLQLVELWRNFLAFCRIHLTQTPHHQADTAFLAERGNPQRLQRIKIGNTSDLRQQFLFKLFNILHHNSQIKRGRKRGPLLIKWSTKMSRFSRARIIRLWRQPAVLYLPMP